MKRSNFLHGQVGLLLLCSVLLVSCNEDEFYPTEEMITGADAYCSEAKDLDSCQKLSDICQPAFAEEKGNESEPAFSQCVANPDLWLNPPDGSGPIISEPEASEPAPTIEEAASNKCSDLGEQYLHVTKFIKKNKVVGVHSKVKVCHQTKSGTPHTIVIACPALNAHRGHDDYLGACSL